MKSLIVASLIGLSAGHFGPHDEVNSVNEVRFTSTEITQTAPVTTIEFSSSANQSDHADMMTDPDMEVAAQNIEEALNQAPNIAASMGHSINEHGVVRAILFQDPEVKASTDSFGASLGRGLSAMAKAVTRDMVEATKQLHPDKG